MLVVVRSDIEGCVVYDVARGENKKEHHPFIEKTHHVPHRWRWELHE
jgi:hypothetical protein